MSDLIDRQAVLKHIEKIRQGVQMMDDTHRASITMNGMYLCEKAVRNQPSAQAEPKKGQWEEKSVFEGEIQEWQSARCSICEKHHTTPYLYYFDNFNYCPNCGARMVVEE